jgi:predicted Zn-ribbon and HTH transcriptional regulator
MSKKTETFNLHSNRRQTKVSKMNEVKKCPKCNGEVQKGNLFTPRNGGTVIKFTDRESESLWILGNAKKVHALACKSCGYVENYKEMNKP